MKSIQKGIPLIDKSWKLFRDTFLEDIDDEDGISLMKIAFYSGAVALHTQLLDHDYDKESIEAAKYQMENYMLETARKAFLARFSSELIN